MGEKPKSVGETLESATDSVAGESVSLSRTSQQRLRSGAEYYRRRLPHFDKPWAYIRSDHDLEEKFHYIVRNPWDAGVAASTEFYRRIWKREDEDVDVGQKQSPSRRDAATNARNARASQSRQTRALPKI